MTSASPSTDDRVGLDLLVLSSTLRTWIPRRHEHLLVQDYSTMRRTVNLDLDLSVLPDWGTQSSDRWPSWRDGLLVPLTVLKRPTPTSFQVRDSAGSLLSRATRDEERHLLYSGACLAVRVRLGEVLPQTADALQRMILGAPRTNWSEPLNQTPQGGSIRAEADLMGMLQTAANNYLLTAEVDRARSRQIITYEEVIDVSIVANAPGWRSDLREMGTITLRVAPLGINYCRSYHIELEAPTNLVNAEAYVSGFVAKSDGTLEQVVIADEDPHDKLAQVQDARQDALLDSSFTVTLRHAPVGIVRSALVSAAFTTLIMGALFVWALVDDTGAPQQLEVEPGSALLLLLPTLIGALLVTPTTHDLTAKVVFPSRLILGLASITPWVGAVLLATGIEGLASRITWGVSFAVSAICAGILARQAIKLRRR